MPRSVAMRLTGHKTESVYRRYAIVAERDLAEGVEKLARLYSSESLRRTTLPFSVPSNGTTTAQPSPDKPPASQKHHDRAAS